MMVRPGRACATVAVLLRSHRLRPAPRASPLQDGPSVYEASVPLSDLDDFVSDCAWLADAHLAQDPEQVMAALCALYGRLVARGWVPSERAATLMHLRDVTVEAALSRWVPPQPRRDVSEP